jgi:hypothetical protein
VPSHPGVNLSLRDGPAFVIYPLRDATPSMRNTGLSAPEEPVCRVKGTSLRPSFWTTCALREDEMPVAFFSPRKLCLSIDARAS